MLRNVKPFLPGYNVADVLLANPGDLGYFSLRNPNSAKRSYGIDHLISQFSIVMFLPINFLPVPHMGWSIWGVKPTFIPGVNSINFGVSQKQMHGVTARRVVAFMKNEFFKRVNPSRKKERKPVSIQVDRVSIGDIVGRKLAIPAIARRAHPLPAIIRTKFIYAAPKSFNMRVCQAWHCLRLVLSHTITSLGLWSEPRNVLKHLRGSLYFTPAIGGCK